MVDKNFNINVLDTFFAFQFKCLLIIHLMTMTDTFGNSINQLLQSYAEVCFRCLHTAEQEQLRALQKEAKQEVFDRRRPDGTLPLTDQVNTTTITVHDVAVLSIILTLVHLASCATHFVVEVSAH